MLRPYCTVTVFVLLSITLLAPTTASTAAHPPFLSPPLQNTHLQQVGPEQMPSRHQRGKENQLPDGLSDSDWASIRTQMTAGKYRAYTHENGGFVSSNPAHGWRIHYASDGTTTLRPRDREDQAYQLGLKLNAVGFTRLQTLDHPQQVTADDSTVSYQWNDDLREWWVNSEAGLEQWFELEQRPPGALEGEPLRFEMTLASDLTASQNGNTLSFANDNGTTISYNKLKVWDASGRELRARMQLAGSQLSLIIDDGDARYPLTVDPSIQQQAYIKASNTEAYDQFGTSMAFDGNTVVVGAPREDSSAIGIGGNQYDNSALSSGAVYVFVRSGTSWSQQAYLKASNTDEGDNFGDSVGISGDTLVVGASKEHSNGSGEADNSAHDAGAVYVYTRSGTNWSQQAYLKAANVGSNDRFGWSVAISGNSLVVGANTEASDGSSAGNNSLFGSGAAYVFTRSGTSWSQQAYLKASNPGGRDWFGASVAIFGNTVVVGAQNEDSNGNQADNSATDAGAAYVFTRNGTVWSQQAYLKASNTDAGDQFGYSVGISGDTVVVGAREENSSTSGVNGDQNNNAAPDAGAAYVFTRSGTSWSQQAYLKASNTDNGDEFGRSVAISGNTVVISATREDSNGSSQSDNSSYSSGAAYIFTRSGTTWSQYAYVKASNQDHYDRFGYKVAVSGNTLVASTYQEDSNATGINGDQANNSAPSAGAIYVLDTLLSR